MSLISKFMSIYIYIYESCSYFNVCHIKGQFTVHFHIHIYKYQNPPMINSISNMTYVYSFLARTLIRDVGSFQISHFFLHVIIAYKSYNCYFEVQLSYNGKEKRNC